MNEHYLKYSCQGETTCLVFLLGNRTQSESLTFVNSLMENNRGKGYEFFHSYKLTNLQRNLNLTSLEEPKLIAISNQKNSVKVHKGSSMNQDDIQVFLDDLET